MVVKEKRKFQGLTRQIMAIKWQCCMPQNNGNTPVFYIVTAIYKPPPPLPLVHTLTYIHTNLQKFRKKKRKEE